MNNEQTKSTVARSIYDKSSLLVMDRQQGYLLAASRGVWITILALWCHGRSSWHEATHFMVKCFHPVFQTTKVVFNSRNIYVRFIKTATANCDATAHAPETMFNVKKLHALRFLEDVAIWDEWVDRQRILTNAKKVDQRPEGSPGENLRQEISLKTVYQGSRIRGRLQVHHPALVLSSLSLELTKQPCVYLFLSMKISDQRNHSGNETDHPRTNRGGYACPSGYGIPPHHATVNAKLLAPKDAIPPTHSMIPPWIGRHFATGARTCAGLATVKPPRDLRTRLREDV